MRVKSTPILAFVDGETGQVIERFPSDLLPKEAVSDEWGWSVERAAVTRGPNGKLYSVIFIEGGWIYWVQGESPKYVPQPFPSDRFSRMALSPDGKTVLIQHDLRPLGIVYDLPIGMRGPKLTPVTGVREALHDAATGVPRWTISETVVAPSDHNSPVISSDGKFGLLALATEPNDKLRRGISVVDMENGRVLEVLPTYGTYNYSFGFAGAGSLIWISQVLVTALYERR